MCDFLPDITDVQNIQTKITFCEDNATSVVHNTALSDVTTEVTCVNIKTELETEGKSNTEDSIPSDNNTNTTDNVPSDLFEFTIHKKYKIGLTHENNEILENEKDRKRKHYEVSTETCFSNSSINEERDQSKCSSAPRKKICSRKTSITQGMQTSNTHTGNESSYSFQNNNSLANNYVDNSNQVKTDLSTDSQKVDSRRDNEASTHTAFANRIVSLAYQLEVLSKSNLNKDINFRNILHETIIECFKSLYPIIMQYVWPKKYDQAYIRNLISFIAATARHKQINLRPDFIKLILKKMIIWTDEENKKAKVQYFADYSTRDLANGILNNTTSDISEKPNDSPCAAKNQEVQSYFFSSSSKEGNGIPPYHNKEPLREPIIESPIINTVENEYNQINKSVIKYNVLQRSNIPVNTANDKTPILKQYLGDNTALPTSLKNVIIPNFTNRQNMNSQLYRNGIPENQPQLNQQHSQKVHNEVTTTPNHYQQQNHQPPIYPANIKTNTPNYYQKCQTQPPPAYPNHLMNTPNIMHQHQRHPVYQNQVSNTILIQQQSQLPPMHQNQISNPPSNIQQVWPQHTAYNQKTLPNFQNILKHQYQQQNQQAPIYQNQSSNNIQQQHQQRPLYQNQMSSLPNSSKQNINVNNIQAYGSSAQNPYQFTNHQEQIRNVPPSQIKSPAASSVYDTTDYFDISLFDALESSNINCDPTQSSSPLSSADNVNITITPISTNPERSMSRDSGFISPPAENMETFSPTITYVTSLNKNVAHKKNGSCCICQRITRLTCLGCHGTYYCSTQCQYMDWNSHKLKCNVTKDNKPTS